METNSNLATQTMHNQHPLSSLRLSQQLMPLAAAFEAPIETFRKCFKDQKEADVALLREVEYAVQAMTANSYLAQCAQKNPDALVNSIKNIALTGLSLNPAVKQAYLVPFKGDITFMPSYIGLRDLLVKTGLVINIEAHLVYVDDEFEVSYGESGYLIHKPKVFSKNRTDKDILGGYYIAELPSGKKSYDTMSIDEIMKVYKASPSYGKTSPWQTWFSEMAKKTLIRKGYKGVPHTNVNDEILKVIEYTMKADDRFFYESKNAPKTNRAFDEFEEVVVGEPINESSEEIQEQTNNEE